MGKTSVLPLGCDWTEMSKAGSTVEAQSKSDSVIKLLPSSFLNLTLDPFIFFGGLNYLGWNKHNILLGTNFPTTFSSSCHSGAPFGLVQFKELGIARGCCLRRTFLVDEHVVIFSESKSEVRKGETTRFGISNFQFFKELNFFFQPFWVSVSTIFCACFKNLLLSLLRSYTL